MVNIHALTASSTRSAVFRASSAFVAVDKRAIASVINFSAAAGSSLYFFLATRFMLSPIRDSDYNKDADDGVKNYVGNSSHRNSLERLPQRKNGGTCR